MSGFNLINYLCSSMEYLALKPFLRNWDSEVYRRRLLRGFWSVRSGHVKRAVSDVG